VLNYRCGFYASAGPARHLQPLHPSPNPPNPGGQRRPQIELELDGNEDVTIGYDDFACLSNQSSSLWSGRFRRDHGTRDKPIRFPNARFPQPSNGARPFRSPPARTPARGGLSVTVRANLHPPRVASGKLQVSERT